MKICTKCKLEKEESEFYKVKMNKVGLCSRCKVCCLEYNREYQKSISRKEYVKKRQNSSEYKEYQGKYQKVYKQSSRYKAYVKKYNNSVEHKEYMRKYRSSEKYKDLMSGIQCRLSRILRCRLYDALKNDYKAGSAVRDLGCTIQELKVHLEKLFKLGMSWENYGKWHIDHIYPLSKVDLTDREQLLRVCHYTNLQPLWARENLAKHNKI